MAQDNIESYDTITQFEITEVCGLGYSSDFYLKWFSLNFCPICESKILRKAVITPVFFIIRSPDASISSKYLIKHG